MNVDMGESMSGSSVSRSVHLTVTLEPGYVIGDTPALVDWLIRTGWSVNDEKINSGVMMTIRDTEGGPVVWDYWPTAMDRSGLPNSATSEVKKANYEKSGIVGARAQELEKLIGPWPADVPEFTDDLIVTG